MLDTQKSQSAPNQNQESKIKNQNLRILLWDIDGTLLQSTRVGAFKEYFAPALEEVYGSSGALGAMSVSGMTDSQIAYEALKNEGFSTEEIFSKIEDFAKTIGEKMSRYVNGQDEPYRLLPGAREILEVASKNPHFVNTLLTGNFAAAAEMKLKYFDLWKYFADKPNTFGEISHDRRQLAKTAGKKIRKFLQIELSNEQFVVIGDTPNDIACARALGAKIVSVATGRNHPSSQLAKYKPDVLLENLGDTKEVLRILETL